MLTKGSAGGLTTYVDGVRVDTNEYGTFINSQTESNAAWDADEQRVDPSQVGHMSCVKPRLVFIILCVAAFRIPRHRDHTSGTYDLLNLTFTVDIMLTLY